MSDIKAGDWVKVTVTGKVEDAHPDGGVLLADWDHYLDPDDGVTFEKIAPPLPTEPGSVVIGRTNLVTFILGTDGLWYTPRGAAMGKGLKPESLTLSPSGHDVIYDAGKKS